MRELCPDHRRVLQRDFAVCSDLWRHLEHTLDDGLELPVSLSKLFGCGHDHLLHRFPQIEVQLLIAAGQKANNLISIYVEHNELARCRVTPSDYLCKCILGLANKVHLLVTNAEIVHVEVVKLDLFVHHVHCCVESLLDVVLHIVCPNADLV